jgi:hypothetical protein
MLVYLESLDTGRLSFISQFTNRRSLALVADEYKVIIATPDYPPAFIPHDQDNKVIVNLLPLGMQKLEERKQSGIKLCCLHSMLFPDYRSEH